MKIKREKNSTGFEIDVKRFYLPYEVYDNCAKCGSETGIDLSSTHYISYPKLDSPNKIYFYCHTCEHGWGKYVELKISLKEVKDLEVQIF